MRVCVSVTSRTSSPRPVRAPQTILGTATDHVGNNPQSMFGTTRRPCWEQPADHAGNSRRPYWEQPQTILGTAADRVGNSRRPTRRQPPHDTTLRHHKSPPADPKHTPKVHPKTHPSTPENHTTKMEKCTQTSSNTISHSKAFLPQTSPHKLQIARARQPLVQDKNNKPHQKT